MTPWLLSTSAKIALGQTTGFGRPTVGVTTQRGPINLTQHYNQPPSTCSAIWDQPTFWTPLLNWIRIREGARRRFYRDSKGWVTIGYGELVDRPHGTPDQRKAAGHAFANSRHALFGPGVTAAQVFRDWLQVYNHSRRAGLLVLTQQAIDIMLQEKTRGYAERMYNTRHHSRCLPGRIQMALIDTAFNPGRHNNLYINRPASHIISRMWTALDRSRSLGNPLSHTPEDLYDPQHALELFDQRWRRITTPPYPSRHAWRLARFREGVNIMRAEDQNVFDKMIRECANSLHP